MVAFDTGFFVAFMRGSKEAMALWRWIKEERIKPVVSTLTIGEIMYILYRENRNEDANGIVEKILHVAKVMPVDITIARKGAEIKYLQKIPYIDSLIGATAILNGCGKLYTSDRKHMSILKNYGLEVVTLHE